MQIPFLHIITSLLLLSPPVRADSTPGTDTVIMADNSNNNNQHSQHGLGGGFGGGLASSPNVPRPGASIDPATGKPYTAGLTRAELQAKRAAEAAEAEAKAKADAAAAEADKTA